MEQLLIPVKAASPMPGAGGSWWQTRLWVSNDNDRPVVAFTTDPRLCQINECAQPLLAPQTSATVSIDTTHSSNPGAFLYVERAALERVAVALNVRNVARSAESAGTEVPVVREESLRREITLLDVPMEPGFRCNFRVYDPAALRDGMVEISVTELGPGGRTFPPFALILSVPPENGTLEYPSAPGYASPDLAAFLAVSTPIRARVTIRSLDGRPIWAFVSTTNNSTHEVTLTTPNPR